MANIIPVSSMVQPPANVVGNFQQGMQLGQQQRQMREQRLDQQNLRNLAPQVIAGDAGAFQQAAAINPEAAGQYQQAGDSQLRRLKGFVDYVNKARETAQQTGDMRHVNAALQQGAPYVSELLGKPAPTEWSPDMEAGWSQLEAQIAMAEGGGQGSSILSTYVDDQGQRVAVNRDGTTQVLGGADLGASQQTISVAGPDGRPRQYTFDRRTGNYVPAEMSGGQPQGQQPSPQGAPGSAQAPLPQGSGQAFVDDSLALANQMISAGIPEAQVDAFLQQRLNQGGAPAPQGGGMAPQNAVPPQAGSMPQQGGGGGGALFVGRSPEEQAALTAAAEEEARQGVRPSKAQEAADTAFANDYAEFVQGGAADTARQIAELRSVASQLRGGQNLTGPVLGMMPRGVRDLTHPESSDVQEQVEQVVQRSLRAILGAQFTEREGERLIARAYNPRQPESVNAGRVERLAQQLELGFQAKQAAADYYEQNGTLRGFQGSLPTWADFDVSDRAGPGLPVVGQAIEAASSAVEGRRPPTQQPPVQRARNPQTGEVLELRNGQWVPAR